MLYLESPHHTSIADLVDRSIEVDGFVIDYQPIVHLSDFKVAAVEALTRLDAGNGRIVMPDEFIPIAVETGSISGLTDSVMQTAVTEVTATHPHLGLSVNVSVLQVTDRAWLRTALDRAASVTAGKLIWEITETEFADEDAVAAAVEQIRSNGHLVAIDDFTSGASTMARLAATKYDIVKVDRGMVARLAVSARHRETMLMIVGLAEFLGAAVVAEGVETPEQAEILGDLGCQYAQGYWFGRPGPLRAVEMSGSVGSLRSA